MDAALLVIEDGVTTRQDAERAAQMLAGTTLVGSVLNKARGASEIGRDFVYSCKPNPAFLAGDRFSPEQIQTDLMETRRICEENGCPLEIILKDITTVRYEPERLFEWARIAMRAVGAEK